MENRYTALEWAVMEGGHELPLAVTPKFSLLQELNEARLYRGADTLKGKSANDLAKVAYLMIMMLEIIRSEDSSFAKTYAQNTVSYDNFDAMRGNATDLHNVLVVLANQHKFENKIATNSNISVPSLQIKKYLRDIVAGRKEAGNDRQLFMKLENFFSISNSQYKNIRRSVGDWKDNSRSEKSTVRNEIKNIMVNFNQLSDLFLHFKNLAHRQEN